MALLPLFSREGDTRTRPFRLGSTVARLELKGIDGGSYKRWSMWFKSIQRAEPYQFLYLSFVFDHTKTNTRETGAAWLSSARVVRCLVQSCNERNPFLENSLNLKRLPTIHRRKAGMTSSPHGP
eukprot:scaffold5782_cov618-Prasinococcus_capsulatus_cf.AAC.18